MSTWNPEQYGKFSHQRRQPFDDLLALVEPRPRMRVVDLGCGTGELTRALHDHLGAAETIGVDNSETMLERSSAFVTDALRFEQGEIETFAGGPFDLVFSNAAFHWVPDHDARFARLASFLAPQGQLAVQMPANDDHPSHTTAAAVAQEMGIAPKPSRVLAVDHYARLLHRLGLARQNVRLQVYGHVLESSRAVVEWVKGTLLTDYERRMTPADFTTFMDRYTSRLIEVLGDARPFFYTYKRVLLWGTL